MAEPMHPTDRAIALMTFVVGLLVTLASSYFIVASVLEVKKLDPVQDQPDLPDNLPRLRAALDQEVQHRAEIAAIVENFCRPLGLDAPIDRMQSVPRNSTAAGDLLDDPVKRYLDYWQRELQERYGVTTFTPWSSGPGTHLTFAELLRTLQAQRDAFAARFQTANGNIRTEWEGLSTRRTQTFEREDQRLQQIREQQIPALSQVLERTVREAGTLWGTMVDAERSNREARTNAAEAHRTVTGARAEVSARLQELEDKIALQEHLRAQALERQEPDGRVLAVDEDLDIAYVNFTRRDRVFPGTRFRVFSVEPGAVRIMKGEVQIYEIGDTMTRAAIVHRDPGAPEIRTGDMIFNVSYERDKPLTITFAGRFTGKYSGEDFESALTEFGDRFEPRITNRTDVVVCGDGYRDDPNFQRARELGVRTITERAFGEYLNLPR